MARPRTVARVHDAVLALCAESGAAALTMEGVAARAGVAKQTLYRSWPSTSALVFDALLARSAPDGAVVVPDTGDLRADLEHLLRASIAEMTGEPHASLLRGLTADIQSDPAMAAEYRARLLEPQLRAVAERLRAGGVDDAPACVELLLAPVLYRWLLRSGPLDDAWVRGHVGRVLRVATR